MNKENDDLSKYDKFEKIITLNSYTHVEIRNNILRLLYFMEDHNEKYNVTTQYLRIKLTDSEKNPFAKDLILEWATYEN